MLRSQLINQTNAKIWALIAAILYFSWPLGYILNPLVAQHGLASELAGAGQPYNWLFVWGDVVSGLAVLVVVIILGLLFKRRLSPERYISLGGLALFGIAIMIAALSQVPCIAALHSCPAFTHNPITLMHGISSVGSCFFLWISLASIWWPQRHNVALSWFVGIYMVYGSVAFVTLFTPAKEVVIQNGFISFCALCILVFPKFFKQSLSSQLI